MHGFKKDRFLRRVAVMCLGILVMGVGIGLSKSLSWETIPLLPLESL